MVEITLKAFKVHSSRHNDCREVFVRISRNCKFMMQTDRAFSKDLQLTAFLLEEEG